MEFKVLISMTNGFREIKKHPKQNLNLLSSLAGLPLLSVLWCGVTIISLYMRKQMTVIHLSFHDCTAGQELWMLPPHSMKRVIVACHWPEKALKFEARFPLNVTVTLPQDYKEEKNIKANCYKSGTTCTPSEKTLKNKQYCVTYFLYNYTK